MRNALLIALISLLLIVGVQACDDARQDDATERAIASCQDRFPDHTRAQCADAVAAGRWPK